ncbi:MAG: DUF429 domain-containing protein [Candidatus Thermoplasmatota archaeon]
MTFVGVDGCRSGWLAAAVHEDGWEISTFPSIVQLWDAYRDADLILIDIPIGLKERGVERGCDLAARKLLGNRSRSVFRVPCRAAVYADKYEEGCIINIERTGKAFSKQTWNIVPKIREVDLLLRAEQSVRIKIRETHPEVCFRALAGHPMHHYKKTADGQGERIRLLERMCPFVRGIVEIHSLHKAAYLMDDLLDALAAAITAMGGAALSSIPDVPEYDPEGLRMEIVHRGRWVRPTAHHLHNLYLRRA